VTSSARVSQPPQAESPRRFRALALIAAGELLAMSLWFSGSAVAPSISKEWGLGANGVSWLTLSVQLGFVLGTLKSAVASLADVLSTRVLFGASAFLGAACNAALAVAAHGPASGMALRFLTGFFLAGVYPPGMKLMATWFSRGRGAALGLLVGGITLGKGFPYLVNAIGRGDWRDHVLAVSALGALGGALVLLFVGEGPYAMPTAPFDLAQIVRVFQNRGVRLADFGYFGHMWELYAMWTWIPVFLRASFAARGAPPRLAETASFVVIGSGFVGCVAAGLLADRIGRPAVTSAAMAVSGLCCLSIGLLFGAPPAALLVVAAIWGASVVADSAQFSASVTELADRRYIGTALTAQTCVGFLLTMVSIEIVPRLVGVVGWRWAFVILAPGPALGIVAMLRLRRLPEAAHVVRGRR